MDAIASPTRRTAPVVPIRGDTSRLRRVGMLDFLDNDPRPAFIVDTTPNSLGVTNGYVLDHWNSAMAHVDAGGLLQRLGRQNNAQGVDQSMQAPMMRFRSWSLEKDASSHPFFLYHGFSWTKVYIANRWNVISGIQTSACAGSNQPEVMDITKTTTSTKVPNFDWTDEIPPQNMTDHASWARSIDWAATSLGPMHSWSPQLRDICNLVMKDPQPAVVFYGPDLIMVYNEAEIELLGGFHPCMGESARVALASVWGEYFEPIIDKNLEGETVQKTNTVVHMVRNGFMEETYFSLKFIPILDAEGFTIGHYEPLVETVRCPSRLS